jgi:hypothetical protein
MKNVGGSGHEQYIEPESNLWVTSENTDNPCELRFGGMAPKDK